MFENKVVDVIKNDRRTKWPNEILGLNTDFTRNNLIRYGTADFDKQIDFNYAQNVDFLDSQSLFDYYTPKENVLLYCYWNMRKQFIALQHVLLQNKPFFLSRFENTEGRIMFIDFGCGPLTASLAFNNAFKAEIGRKLHYLCVDVSKAMLDKAREFSESGVFKSTDTFDFCETIENNNSAYYKDEFILPYTVVLTCANSLSNLNLDDVNELAGFLNNFMSQYPLNNYILVYQNPVNRDQNLRKLLAKTPKLNKVFIAREEAVSYDSPEQDWYATNEQFSYELITN
jgi:DNA replication ATP-dependent helicase Dna2